MRHRSWIAMGAIALATSHAAAQLRVVSYNMLDKPASLTDTATVSQVNAVFGAIASRSVNGIAKRPDIIVLSEQTVASPGNLASILNSLYGVSTYTAVTPTSPQSQGSSDRVAFVYDNSSVTISSTPVALTIGSAYPRPTIRAGFRPIGYSGAAADVYVYGMHLRASQGDANVLERANQTAETRANADALPAGSNIIYAGDFNVYTSDEQGYRNLFNSGNGQAADPINASYTTSGAPIAWNNNSAYAAVHTQSTRTSSLADGGATGGVDDRFDYQLVSNGMMDGNGISYIGPTSPGTGAAHSYVALGNNGKTFNLAINSAANDAEAVPVLNALHNLSDHLPIVADYQLPAKMTAFASALPSEVIQGANVSTSVSVTNTAAVVSALGADALDFTVSATNVTTTPQSGSIRATQGASVKTLVVNTATPGSKTVQVNVTSTNQGVVGGTHTQNLPITVYGPAQPSLRSDVVQASGNVDLGVVAIGSTLGGSLSLYNVAGTLTAGLDIDSSSAIGSSAFDYVVTPQSNLEAGGSANISFSFAPTLSQTSNGVLTIQTSDVDLPGAQPRGPVTISFTARGAFAGDANLSDSVDFDDLLILAQNYETSGATWFTADFNRDGFVGFDDLLAMAQNYVSSELHSPTGDFAGDWALARTLVPEPATLALLALAAPLSRRRK